MKIENLNEYQLRLIQDAVEFYSRFLMGQVDIPQELILKNEIDIETKTEALGQLKKACFPELQYGQSWGVGKYDKIKQPIQYKSQVGYEIYKTIANFLYNQQTDKTTYSVDKNPPLIYSQEPIIRIKKED